MKNLKQEIEKISKTYPIIKVMLFVDGFEDDLLNLFRSWALECVGEDDEVMYEEIDTGAGVDRLEYNCSHNDRVRGYNQAKLEVRKKIEEELEK